MRYDCHVEIFDPARWRPAAQSSAEVALPGGALSAFLQQPSAQVPVFVQPFAYCGSHGCLLDALHVTGAHARGVGCLSRYMPVAEVEDLDQRGVRGTRFVVARRALPELLDDVAALHALLPAHWHIELSGSAHCLSQLSPGLARYARKFVGMTTDLWRTPLPSEDCERLLWWLEMGNFYLKLVLPAPAMCRDSLAQRQPELSHGVVGMADRLLWGSGWPCPGARELSTLASPSEPDLLTEWAQTLDDNAQALYGFVGR